MAHIVDDRVRPPRAGTQSRRFYVLAMTRDLFGGWMLWRELGRRGSPGTLRCEIYEQEEAAASAARRIVRRRAARLCRTRVDQRRGRAGKSP
jgi:predicted DNA-binding WGR domain protein